MDTLSDQPTSPKGKTKRTGEVEKQMGYSISQRNVERTITDYGLQKNLYKLVPSEQVELQVQRTKRERQQYPPYQLHLLPGG